MLRVLPGGQRARILISATVELHNSGQGRCSVSLIYSLYAIPNLRLGNESSSLLGNFHGQFLHVLETVVLASKKLGRSDLSPHISQVDGKRSLLMGGEQDENSSDFTFLRQR